MLIRTYQCDLCGNVIANPESLSSAERPSRRIYRFDSGIKLCDMSDPLASEKVLCGRCLTDLAKALGIKE